MAEPVWYNFLREICHTTGFVLFLNSVRISLSCSACRGAGPDRFDSLVIQFYMISIFDKKWYLKFEEECMCSFERLQKAHPRH